MDDQQTETEPRRPWRKWFWLACVLLVSAVLGLGYYYVWMPDNRLEHALARVNATDPHWQIDDVIARRIELPDEENSALQIMKLKAMVPPPWLTEPESTQLFAVPPEVDLTPAQVTLLRKFLEKAEKAVPEARKLSSMPYGRFPLQLKPDMLSVIINSQDARTAANVLQLDAMQRAHDGDIDGALDSALACLNASRSIGDEPFMISMLIRLAVRTIAVRSMERALGQGEASAAKLAQVQSALEADERENLLVSAVYGERAGMDHYLAEMMAGRVNAKALIASMGKGPTGYKAIDEILLGAAAAPTMSRAAMLEYNTDMLEVAKLPPHERAARLREIRVDPRKLPLLARVLIPATEKIVDADTRNLAWVRPTIVGLALERYRIDHSVYPDSLDQLMPSYLKAVPLDPYDGKPLRYRRLADGVVVYSIGQDGTDDGGVMDRDRYTTVNTDYGFRLWDVKGRKQMPKPEPRVEGGIVP